jgi:protease-4
MSVETDLLIDRRRLKRRLSFWRAAAVLFLVIALLVAAGGRVPGTTGGSRIARLNVTGIISEQRKLTDAIRAAADDGAVKALIVSIDSPGGSVAGGQSLYDAIAAVAAKKPVVAVMEGTAASAGYMVAMPAARIFAREGTLTGSIGVLLQTGEFSGLLGKVGIGTDVIVSGPLKDQPGLTHPLSGPGREVLQGLVNDMYEQFVDVVARGRHMDADAVRKLADGRPYTGRQALKLNLIDQIGGETDAVAWLEHDRKVPAHLQVRDLSTEPSLTARALGESLSGLLGDGVKTLLSQGLKVDQPMAIWQPSWARSDAVVAR